MHYHHHSNDIESVARRRAGAKLGWYVHASIYFTVNLVLGLMAYIGAHPWHLFPLLGWGLALTIHGILVLLRTNQFGLHERMIQRERDRLAQHNT